MHQKHKSGLLTIVMAIESPVLSYYKEDWKQDQDPHCNG